jgi:hypothetical protein
MVTLAKRLSIILPTIIIICLSTSGSSSDLPDENLLGKPMLFDNLTYSVSGVSIADTSVERGKALFRINQQQDADWNYHLQFSSNAILSSVQLQLPVVLKNYMDYLALSIRFGNDHREEYLNIVQIYAYETPSQEKKCNFQSMEENILNFFCGYITSTSIEVRVSTRNSPKLKDYTGEYCISLFHVPAEQEIGNDICVFRVVTNPRVHPQIVQTFVSISLDTDQMIYGVKIRFMTGVDAEILKDSLKVVVNGTYDQTTNKACGEKFDAMVAGANRNNLIFSCGFAGNTVYLLSRLIGESINLCSVEVFADPFCNVEKPRNSDVTVTSFWPGGTTPKSVKIECRPGYNLSSSVNTLQCSSQGVWSQKFPSCPPVFCGKPPSPINGYIRGSGYYFSNTVTFICNIGYIRRGATQATCMSSALWSDRAPICEIIDCGQPPSKSYSTYRGASSEYGATVTYECEDGYCWDGDMSVRCGSQGIWEGTVPECFRVNCGQVSEIQDGIETVQSTYLGGIVRYSCKSGFDVVGVRTRTCTYASVAGDRCRVRWSDSSPSCRPKDCGPLTILNGIIVNVRGNGRHYQSIVRYQCNIGHKLAEGSEERECQHTGVWSGSQPICSMVQCENPEVPEHGWIEGKTFSYGSRIKYFCNPGYRIIGKRNLDCTAKGKWTKGYPRCAGTYCQPITVLLNGVILHMDYHVGGYVQFQCKEGHDLNGDEQLNCYQPPNSHAQWNSSLPTCQPKRCTTLTAPNNGFMYGRSFTFPNSVEFACEYGYLLTNGDSVRSCDSTGLWTGVSPTCQSVICQPPKAPIHGSVSSGPYHYMRKITFWCDASYALIGSSSSTCMASGTWSSSPPRCINIRCPELEHPLNGKVTVSSTAVGGRASYKCKTGFNIITNVQERVCQRTSVYSTVGVWSGDHPYCDRVTCDAPTDPLYGQVIGRHFYYPNSIRYKCNAGYRIISGDETRNCSEAGRWTGRPAECGSMCLQHYCPEGQKCAVGTDGKVLCLCNAPEDCSSRTRYVCGSDGETYTNDCHLQVAACRLAASHLKPLSQVSTGACKIDCSYCSSNADCVDNSLCICHTGHIGDGKTCCPQALESQVTITGASAVFDCKAGCDLYVSSFIWKHKGHVLSSQQNVEIIDGGSILVLKNLAEKSSGVYTCEMNVKGVVYNRAGVLEVSAKGVQPSEDKCGSDCGISCARNLPASGGGATGAGQFPWQAMLCLSGVKHHCSGVLVTKDCIVTAAHCIDPQTVIDKTLTVCLGRHCGNCSESDGVRRPQCSSAFTTTSHPLYDRSSRDNDIAIMRLGSPVKCHCSNVMPICLPDNTSDDDPTNTQMLGIVTGWGTVNSRSRCMKQGHVRLSTSRECQQGQQNHSISKSMKCSLGYRDACEGDKGAPLVVQNMPYGGRYMLAGLTSRVLNCETDNSLGIYTNIPSHLPWIRSECGI